jgi:hypothetical protein
MQSSDPKCANHSIFSDIDYYTTFYESFSDSVLSFRTNGTTAILNMDTYVYMSIKGTLESISLVLKNGKLNDAYALLRKYYDSVIINTYTNQYINDNACLSTIYVEKINNWLHGKSPLPRMQAMTKYLNKADNLSELNALINIDSTYEKIRNRCNDHMHYNFFELILLNEGKVFVKNRLTYIDQLSHDLKNIFIMHLAYIFLINQHYMGSSDYVDHLEFGQTPPDNCQYWVAPFVQEAVDKLIKVSRPDIASLLINNTDMHIE